MKRDPCTWATLYTYAHLSRPFFGGCYLPHQYTLFKCILKLKKIKLCFISCPINASNNILHKARHWRLQELFQDEGGITNFGFSLREGKKKYPKTAFQIFQKDPINPEFKKIQGVNNPLSPTLLILWGTHKDKGRWYKEMFKDKSSQLYDVTKLFLGSIHK